MASYSRRRPFSWQDYYAANPTETQQCSDPTFEELFALEWPFERLGFDDPTSIFTTLSEKYNTFQCTLQNHRAFYLDVSGIALEATDVDDFYRRMAIRQNERFAELQNIYNHSDLKAMDNKERMDEEQIEALRQISVERSLDAFVNFVGSLGLPRKEQTELCNQKPNGTRDDSHQPDTVRPGATPMWQTEEQDKENEHVEPELESADDRRKQPRWKRPRVSSPESDEDFPYPDKQPPPPRPQPKNGPCPDKQLTPPPQSDNVSRSGEQLPPPNHPVQEERRPGFQRKRKAYAPPSEQPEGTRRNLHRHQPRTSRRLSRKTPEFDGGPDEKRARPKRKGTRAGM